MSGPLPTRQAITGLKLRLVRAIERQMAPHMRGSGYRIAVDSSRPRFAEGNSRPLMLYAPATAPELGLFCGEVIAITEGGFISDAHAGGAIVTPFLDYCLEDLMKVEAWTRDEAERLRTSAGDA